MLEEMCAHQYANYVLQDLVLHCPDYYISALDQRVR